MSMSISSLIGSHLLSGIAAFALTGSLVGATAMAAGPSNPIAEIRHEVRDQSKVHRDEIKQLRAELAAEYAKDRPDAEKLEQLRAAIEAKRSEISELRFAALMQMHDQLDAEQRARMAEKMAHEGKRRGHADERGEGDGKGKPDVAERGKGKSDDKGKPDMAERGKGKSDGKGKPDVAERGKGKSDGKGKSVRAPI
jgi:TolA-binding protein